MKSSWAVPRARWSVGGIVGASGLSEHEQWRIAVYDSGRDRVNCHGRDLTPGVRDGLRRSSERMVAEDSQVLGRGGFSDLSSPPLYARNGLPEPVAFKTFVETLRVRY